LHFLKQNYANTIAQMDGKNMQYFVRLKFRLVVGLVYLACCLIGCSSSEFTGQQDQGAEMPSKDQESDHKEIDILHSEDLSPNSDAENLNGLEALVVENKGLSCARSLSALVGSWQGSLEGAHEALGQVRASLHSAILHPKEGMLKFDKFILRNTNWWTGTSSGFDLQEQSFELSCEQTSFDFHIIMGSGLTHIFFTLNRHQWNPNELSGIWTLRNIRTGVEPARGTWHLKPTSAR